MLGDQGDLVQSAGTDGCRQGGVGIEGYDHSIILLLCGNLLQIPTICEDRQDHVQYLCKSCGYKEKHHQNRRENNKDDRHFLQS